jgi:hypothetical protein
MIKSARLASRALSLKMSSFCMGHIRHSLDCFVAVPLATMKKRNISAQSASLLSRSRIRSL